MFKDNYQDCARDLKKELSYCRKNAGSTFPAHFNRSLISSVHLPDRQVKVTGSKNTFSLSLPPPLPFSQCSSLSCASQLNFSSHCRLQRAGTFSPLHRPQLVYFNRVSLSLFCFYLLLTSSSLTLILCQSLPQNGIMYTWSKMSQVIKYFHLQCMSLRKDSRSVIFYENDSIELQRWNTYKSAWPA